MRGGGREEGPQGGGLKGGGPNGGRPKISRCFPLPVPNVALCCSLGSSRGIVVPVVLGCRDIFGWWYVIR